MLFRSMNENRFGSAIRKETPGWVLTKLPNSKQFFDSTTYFSRWATEKLSSMTGGKNGLAGSVDINPALLDHLVQSYVPGLPAQLFRSADVAYRKSLGLEMPEKNPPFLGRVMSIAPEGYDAGAINKFGEYVETTYNAMKTMPWQEQDKMRAENPNLGDMHMVVTTYRNYVNTQQANLKKIDADQSIPDDQKIILRNIVKRNERAMATQMVRRAVELGYDKHF